MRRCESIRLDGSSSRPNRLLCDGKTRNNQWSVEKKGRQRRSPVFAGAASRLRAAALRRASAQAGRHLAVLTYSLVRSARPSGCGLPFERSQGRTGQAFLNPPVIFSYGSGLSICGSTGKILQLFNSPIRRTGPQHFQ
jgi:hypothetical protein